MHTKIGGVYFESWSVNKFLAIATTQNISFMNSPLFSQSDILMKFSEAKHVGGCCDMGRDKTCQLNSAFVRAALVYSAFKPPTRPLAFATVFHVCAKYITRSRESNFCANPSRRWRLREVLMRRYIVGNYENAPVFDRVPSKTVEFRVGALVRSGGDVRALMDCD